MGHRFVGTLVALAALMAEASGLALATVSELCTGDCDGDGQVMIGELVIGVNIALERAPITNCPSFDTNDSGRVEINELVQAVNNVLDDCGAAPSPTPDSVQPTATPTRTRDPILGGALGFLDEGELRAANAELAKALADHPDDPRANLYYAITRIAARFLDDPRLTNLIAHVDQTMTGDSTDVCEVKFKKKTPYPDDAPRSGEMIAALREVLGPEITAALEQVERLPDDVNIRFSLADLPDCLCPPTDVETIEIDRADVLAFEAFLRSTAAALDLLVAYDLDVDSKLARERRDKLVLEEPGVLSLLSPAMLSSGRDQLEQALSLADQVIQLILAETDDQSDDVLVIVPEEVDNAHKIQRVIALMRQSLRQQVTIPIDVITGEVVLMDIGILGQERINMNALFSGQFASVRQFLPALDFRDRLDGTRFPDPTFDGMVPDLTQDKINRFLSESDYDLGHGNECAD